MPTKREIGSTIKLDGEKEYRAALNEAMASVKLLGLEVKENTTAYGKNSESIQGNKERVALLKNEIEKQKEVVQSLAERTAYAAEKTGETSKTTQDYQEKLIKARTALAAMTNELGDAEKKVPSVGDKVKELAGKLGSGLVEGAKNAASAVGSAMSTIGEAVGNAVNKITDLTSAAGLYADTILTISQTTGVATQDLMKWEYAGQFIDVSVDTITGSMTKLTKNMRSTTSDVTSAFQTLGISVTDSTGQMRDDQTVFFEIIDALGKVTNETERDQLAMTLLGRSAKDLNPMILSGSEAFKQLGEEAQQAGLIMSDDSLSAFGAYDDACNVLKSSLTAAGRSIAEVFLPATQSVVQNLTDVVQAFTGMVKGTDGAREKFNAVIDKMIKETSALITDWLPKVLEMGVNILLALIDGIIKSIPKLTAELPKVVNTITTFIVNNLPAIIQSGIAILTAISTGIIQSIPTLVARLPDIITAIVNGLAKGVAQMARVGTQLVAGLWEGLKSATDWLYDKICDWVGDVMQWFKNLFGIHSPSTFGVGIGKNVGSSVGLGIADSASDVQKAIDDILPDAKTLSLDVSATTARHALSARPIMATGETRSASQGNSIMQEMADAMVQAMQRAGVGEGVLKIDGREMGRYMRRGMEAGFV